MTAPAPVSILVDGTNVHASRPDGWWRNRARAAAWLVTDLDRLCRCTRRTCTVVFDRLPRRQAVPASTPRVQVLVAPRSGPDADDDAIVALVANLETPGAAFVHTSDRRLRDRLHALGARTDGARRLLTYLDNARAFVAPLHTP